MDESPTDVDPPSSKPRHAGRRNVQAGPRTSNRMAEFEQLVGPLTPCRPTVYVVVQTKLMTAFFTAIYYNILNALYPSNMPLPAKTITAAQFVLMCRFYTKSRIDYVHTEVLSRRTDGRIPMSEFVALPSVLTRMINGLGAVRVTPAQYKVIPAPEVQPVEVNERLNSSDRDREQLQRFDSFSFRFWCHHN